MTFADLLSHTVFPAPGEKRRADELDVFGMTHRGRVRRNNQDHFLVGTVRPDIEALHGLTPHPGRLPIMKERGLDDPASHPLGGEWLATIMLVADGVGSGPAGGTASRLAAEAVTRRVAATLRSEEGAGNAVEAEFLEALRRSALEADQAVRAEAAAGDEPMATTLTMAVVLWPWLYLVQVGDSRCYLWNRGTLTQLTRDQTMARDLVDAGAFTEDQVAQSPLNDVLTSAIGSTKLEPVVSRHPLDRSGYAIVLCSDGLTKHVRNREIAGRLKDGASAEEACRSLVSLALIRGGTDNVTVVVGRG